VCVWSFGVGSLEFGMERFGFGERMMMWRGGARSPVWEMVEMVEERFGCGFGCCGRRM
jgi:hypothetical protein